MSYNSNIPQQKYVASAGQTVFPFLFKIFQEVDLTVYKVTEGDDPELATPLTLNVDYTVIINGDLGGSITLIVGASDGALVTIYRRLDITRYVEYQTSGDLLADTLNADQDYQTYLTADLADAVKEELSGASPGQPIGEYVRRTGDTMTGALSVPPGAAGAQVPQTQEVDAKITALDIETIENANGSAIKYPDGTMICYFRSTTLYTTTDVVGSVFRNLTVPSWTYPVPFVGLPVMTATVVGNNTWVTSASTGITETSGRIFIYGASSSSTGTPHYQAVGRWKA